MSQATPNLLLPYIQPAQAQKHVTHNEALQVLDALVQPVAIDRDRASPPSEPVKGDCHIVGAGAGGGWTGQDNKLAVFANGGWMFIAPRAGWTVQVLSEQVAIIFDGQYWTTTELTGAATFGINSEADNINRLSVAADATLLNHAGSGHQLKINKADAGQTNSLLFQTGFSGRAEMGCSGADDFAIKVSDDGSTFREGLVIDGATGQVRFPNGIAGTVPTANQLSGQLVVLVGERNTTLSTGTYVAFGNGSTLCAGPVMPFAAKVVAITISVAGGTAGITKLDLALDKVSDPAYRVNVTYPTSGEFATAIADFSTSPKAVPAGTALSMKCSSTVGAQQLVTAVYVIFD